MTARIKRVRYIHAADPCGRMLLYVAGQLWSADPIADWRENEYARGQVETLADSVRVSDFANGEWLEYDEVKDRIAELLTAASQLGYTGLDEKLRELGLA